MVKKVLLLGVTAVFIFSLSGCAATRKDNDLQAQGLRNKILALQTELQEKDDEINSLKDSMVKSSEEVNLNVSKTEEVKRQVDPKQIQTALKNAGYYQGVIDGKPGKKTRRAIREFQKANNLPVDGRVGEKTWLVLKDYLEKKVK